MVVKLKNGVGAHICTVFLLLERIDRFQTLRNLHYVPCSGKNDPAMPLKSVYFFSCTMIHWTYAGLIISSGDDSCLDPYDKATILGLYVYIYILGSIWAAGGGGRVGEEDRGADTGGGAEIGVAKVSGGRRASWRTRRRGRSSLWWVAWCFLGLHGLFEIAEEKWSITGVFR